MKKIMSTCLLAAVRLGLAACGGEGAGELELTVFAAASMTEALAEIKAAYEAGCPGVTLRFNFDSSGTLLAQIREGAACDLFISAAPGPMNALEEAGALAEGSRIDLLENQVVLCVPDGNPKGIDGFETLAQALGEGGVLLAMGSGDVPVGQYTRRILIYCGLDEKALAAAGCVTYGSNVKEVAAQVREGSADCGVVYRTDALAAKLTVVDTAAVEMCGRAVYPAGVLKDGENREAAQAFLDYLAAKDAMDVFERAGFIPVG